jgi:hypothetical protein
MSIVESIWPGLIKKVVISFPSEGNMWRFFESSDLREFKLDSSKRTVTGRFLSIEIERAQQMNGIVKKTN